jgi:hypothetical protein
LLWHDSPSYLMNGSKSFAPPPSKQEAQIKGEKDFVLLTTAYKTKRFLCHAYGLRTAQRRVSQFMRAICLPCQQQSPQSTPDRRPPATCIVA